MPAARYSFVVELEPADHPFVGRIEHILSGQSLEFDSADAMLAFIERALLGRELIPPRSVT